jgi:tRNA threonylcarbamoyladenosine biosynthesis protein TsaB
VNPPAALLLALDTSTSTASVALFDGQRVLSEATWLAGREHSTRLLVEVEVAFDRIGRRSEELTGLVVAIGPGSFTGVRVAVSVAKGMAAGLALPLWGVSTLDVVACAAGPVELPVRAVVEAGRGRYVTALYRDGQCVQPAALATLEQLAALLTERTLVIGELTAEARAHLAQHPDVVLPSSAAVARRAGFLAELGWRQAQAGHVGDPRVVDAFYVT